MRTITITDWFPKFLKRCGFPKVTLHSLCHSNASLMIAEENRMDKLLKAMYDNLYVPLRNEKPEQGIDECHKQLIERLENRSINWCCKLLMTWPHVPKSSDPSMIIETD